MNHSLQIHILQAALEGRFVGNRGKRRQSDAVEENQVAGVCLQERLRRRRAARAFYVTARAPKVGNYASEYLRLNFFF